MKPLDPQSRRLLDEVSATDRPPADVQARVWKALAPRLGSPLPPTAAAASHTPLVKPGLFAASPSLLKLCIGLAVVGVSAMGVVHYRGRRAADARAAVHSPASAAAVAPSSPPARAPSNLSAPPAQGAASSPSAAQPSAARLGEVAETSGRLSEETRLLARAQRALHNGEPNTALRFIAQHAARFPRGALAQERDAARIFALCALARTTEARRAQHQFRQAWPSSPLAARVHRACAKPTR